MNQLSLYAISAVLALIPAILWLTFLFKKNKRKGLQLLIFFTGTLTVIPVFAFQYFLQVFPQFDVVNFLQGKVHSENLNYIFLFIGVGIVEEIVKQMIVRFIDRRYLLIQTINESIQFSLISALGFSFIENIFYIYNIWTGIGIEQVIVPYMFRSVFTTCAHLVFSGVFGYYYGIAKFSLNIREQSRWVGKKLYFTNFLSRVFGMARSQAFKEQMILKGLFIAIAMHAAFDFLLQLNQIIPVVIFIAGSAAILFGMLRHRAGHLIMVTDIDEKRASSMAKTDEDVVIELVGMWFKEKKYVDVIHICKRLLERDPDNKVIQLFKAQAIDKMDQNSAYAKILQTMFPSEEEKNSLAKLMKEKEKSAEVPPVTQTQTTPPTEITKQ